jgi:hypothetical protein
MTDDELQKRLVLALASPDTSDSRDGRQSTFQMLMDDELANLISRRDRKRLFDAVS